jgi:hypothetical protein
MDAKTIINLGLGMLGSYSVNSIAPAVTPLEKKMAIRYPQFRDSELTKNRWVFARLYATLTLSVPVPSMATAERPNAFAKPNDCLRPIRSKGAKWEVRGGYIYTSDSALTIEYIARIVEADFDPLFVDMLAARIAMDMCEDVTQSNIKKGDARTAYREAKQSAKAANALIIGSDDDMTEPDDDDSWIQARRGVGL